MFLLDTPVLLELRKAGSDRIDAGVMSWATATPRQKLFVSALSFLELERAVLKLERTDKAGGASLRNWLDDQVGTAFEGRVLAVDGAVARKSAALPLAERDSLVAATALVHGLTLVTPNTAAFRAGRLKIFSPWGYRPETDEEAEDWRQAGKSSAAWLKNLFLRS
ncbi:MAG TPA: type II toxin-antitoxin system VapC family toxin [Magnetospirillaceae bacterium]|nr:type II toxin-antitoxin system VapC family toxin [Magnetospirillaceae bacterium]